MHIHKVIRQRQANLMNELKWKKCLKEENFKSWSKRYFIVMISVIEITWIWVSDQTSGQSSCSCPMSSKGLEMLRDLYGQQCKWPIWPERPRSSMSEFGFQTRTQNRSLIIPIPYMNIHSGRWSYSYSGRILCPMDIFHISS